LRNQLSPALNYYQQSLKLRQQIGDRPKESISRYSLAQLYAQQGKFPQAKQEIEQAIKIIEILRGQVNNQELRTYFLGSKQDYYRFYIDLLMQQHRQFPRQGWDAKALAISEQSKARSLLDLLRQMPEPITQGITPQQLAQKQQLEEQLESLERRRIQLFNQANTQTINPQQTQELETQLTQVSEQYQQLLTTLKQTSPGYANLTQPSTLNLKQIQALLTPDTALLEYALGQERSYLWVVTKNQLQSYTLLREVTLNQAVKEFRDSFLIPSNRLRRSLAIRTGFALRNQILPPQLTLKNQRLVIVGDGSLLYLPFAALPDREKLDPQLKYLIDNHELTFLPSASVLKTLRDNSKNRPLATKTLAIFADPVFNLQDERLKPLGLKASPSVSPELMRSARESGVLFDRLPFTQTEAEQILALLPQQSSLPEIGFSANRNRSLNAQMDQYRLIHFATHGLLNSQSPQLSGLVLSLFNPQGRSQNGFLRLYDIFNLRLAAELVVLSACQTGLGKAIKGEGLIGLTRGFMYAGANRVVVSLWSVDDLATSLLMTEFYRGILQKNLSPGLALQKAQQKIKGDKDLASPYYWAAFTLQGEWQGLRSSTMGRKSLQSNFP
ncbi:MAG: CHAT domain-containing protein, partial [Microcystaceae cyanobacterium]